MSEQENGHNKLGGNSPPTETPDSESDSLPNFTFNQETGSRFGCYPEFETDAQERNIPFMPPVLKLMIVIVDWERVKYVREILRDQFVHFQYVCVGVGTASSDVLNVLGVGSVDKAIVFCLQPEFRIVELMELVSKKIKLEKPGNGIAFTIPLSGVSNPISNLFNKENLKKIVDALDPQGRERIFGLFRERSKERVERHMEQVFDKDGCESIRHDLVIAVVNQGFNDALMDVAKSAGATGGTVIRARRIGVEHAVKFFGISAQEEKEIVAIVTKRETKKAIMKAINHFYGMTTEAKGIVFALPVDSLEGISFG